MSVAIDYKSLYEQSQFEIIQLKQQLAQLQKINFKNGDDGYHRSEYINLKQL